MNFIAEETWQKNCAEVIIFNEKEWLNEKHIEVQLQHSNLSHITDQYSSKTKTKITRLWQMSALHKVFKRRFCNSGNIILQNNTCSKF